MHRSIATLVAAVVFVVAARGAWADEGTAITTDDAFREAVRKEVDAALAARTTKDEKDGVLRARWQNGLLFEGPGKLAFRLFGRIHLDAGFLDADEDVEAATGEFESGALFRRARLGVSGNLGQHLAFKAEYDFAGGDADFTDVFLAFTNLRDCLGCGVPNVQVGHFLEPFSLDMLTSDNDLMFIEYALPNAFAPVRNTGVMLHDALWGDRITWAVGFFGQSDDFGSHVWRDGTAVTARVTGLAWAPCDCPSRYLQVGASASYRWDLDSLRYRARPEASVAPRVVDTGDMAADGVLQWGAEVLFTYDRFSVQAEVIGAEVDAPGLGDPSFLGWYAQASWFPFGPSRPLSRKAAVPGRVKPCTTFLEDCRGPGSFEVAVRYSTLDLSDAGVLGGDVRDITIGLNWYLHTHARIMLNYIHAEVSDAVGVAGADGSADILLLRFQVAF